MSDIEAVLAPFERPWQHADGLSIFCCHGCKSLYLVRFDHREGLYECVPLTEAASELARDLPTLDGVICAATTTTDGLDPLAESAADWLAARAPDALEQGVDDLLGRLSHVSTPAILGLLQLLARWAMARVATAHEAGPLAAKTAQVDKETLVEALVGKLAAGLEPRTPPVGEANDATARLRIASLDAAFDAVERACAAKPAGRERAVLRLRLLRPLHRLFSFCLAPANGALLLMPDDAWRSFASFVGRDGRASRGCKALRALLQQEEPALPALWELLHRLVPLYGVEKPATAEELALFEAAQAHLTSLPSAGGFGDPVGLARYDAAQLARRAKGEGPLGDVVDP